MDGGDRAHVFFTTYAIIVLMAFALDEIWITATVGLICAPLAIYLIERDRGNDWLKRFWKDD